jgi:membrane protein YqaA with SNARE-associated domain
VHRLAVWIETTLVPALGPFGVFVVSFLDSSFLSFPEVNDLLVVAAAAADPAQAPLYAAMATMGSVVGCLTLWRVGRRGGEARLVQRFGAERLARVRRAYARFDALALAAPALLPPPMPFKIFVLAAGVLGMPQRRFAITLLLARGLRFAFWGALGAAYGAQGMELLRRFDAWFATHARELVLAAGGLGLLVLGWRLWRRHRRAGGGTWPRGRSASHAEEAGATTPERAEAAGRQAGGRVGGD